MLLLLVLTGVVALPPGSSFPGVPDAGSDGALGSGKKKGVFYATCGDKGIIKTWRSDTGVRSVLGPQHGP